MNSLPYGVVAQTSVTYAVVRCGIAEPSGRPAPMGQKTQYKDNCFDKAFMRLFVEKMSIASGKTTDLAGYDALVDISKKLMQGRNSKEQQAAVREVLLSLLPKREESTAVFRRLFPSSKSVAEACARVTVPFFQWLVGPCKVFDVDVYGVQQRSGVKISKCRFIESSGCVGMCVNMCKVPTQDFFNNDFGLPLTMKPNFEDMSCEMIYGLAPPSAEEDPALKQPCYSNMTAIGPTRDIGCPKLPKALVTH